MTIYNVSFNGVNPEILNPVFNPLMQDIMTNQNVSNNLRLAEKELKVNGSEDITEVVRLAAHKFLQSNMTGKVREFEKTATLTQLAFLEFIGYGTIALLRTNIENTLAQAKQIRATFQHFPIPGALQKLQAEIDSLERGIENFSDKEKVQKAKDAVKAYVIDNISKPLVATVFASFKALKDNNLKVTKLA